MDGYQRFLLAACLWTGFRAVERGGIGMYLALLFFLLCFVVYQPRIKCYGPN